MVVTCLRLQFCSVGSGWQWISEDLNCVRFLFKFVTWKIGRPSHLNDIFLSCFCYAFVRVCLLMPCGPLLGKGWLLGSRLWCLIGKLSLSNWYPGSGVGLIISIPDLCPLSYFQMFPRDNIRKPFTWCITQSLNSQIHVHLIYWIAFTDLKRHELFSQPLHIINKLGQFMSILPTVILPRWKEPKNMPKFHLITEKHSKNIKLKILSKNTAAFSIRISKSSRENDVKWCT